MSIKTKRKQYRQYLISPAWITLRKKIIEERGAKCEKCKNDFHPNSLQIHHLTYARIFNERPEDLLVVCKVCHESIHGIVNGEKPKKEKKNKKRPTREAAIERVLRRQKNGKYKTTKAFNTAMKSVERRYRHVMRYWMEKAKNKA